MSTPADAVLNAARNHLKEPGTNFYYNGDDSCASFVSQVFKEAGVSPVIAGGKWSGSASVPAIVAEFPSSQRDPSELDGDLADLVIFGAPPSHVMIYSGSGHVIGTSGKADANGNLIPGSTTVVEKTYQEMQPPFAMILHTGIATSDQQGMRTSGSNQPDLNPIDAVATAATEAFGTLFSWVPGFAVNAGILVFAAVLVWAGLREMVNAAD